MTKFAQKLATSALLSIALLGSTSLCFATAIPATSGVDTNQTTLPFSIGGVQVMVMSKTGLGVATTGSPAYTLDVNGTLRIANGLYNSGGLLMLQGDDDGGWLRINQSTAFTKGVAAYGQWSFGNAGVAVGGFTSAAVTTLPSGWIYATKAVSIGGLDTALTAGQLYVASAIAIGSANSNPAYSVDATGGTMSAASYFHNSDMRLKTDIHPISNALDKLLAIKGVEFNWKQDGRADMGVVAQNVAEVFPDIVSKNKEGMMSVEYDSLIGPMIESMRELKAQNDELRNQVNEVRSSLEELKAENKQLKSVRADKVFATSPYTAVSH